MNSVRQNIMSFVVAVIFMSALHADAATPANYKNRIDGIRPHVAALAKDLGKNDRDDEQGIVNSILLAIPATEKIEWPGGTIETENQWLRASFDEFAKEPNLDKRRAILTSVGERLAAISASVGDLETATKAESTKDTDKQRLGEILRREEFQKPEPKEESLFQKWWRELNEWLESLLPKPDLTPSQTTNFAPLITLLQVLVFVAVVGLVGFLVYRFVPFFSGRFRFDWKKGTGTRIILGERVGEDESASDLFDEAEQLARAGDLRGAIRKGYIAALCELGDRKIVRLAHHKTNRDYLRESRKRDSVYAGMSDLTNSFERNWYGLRAAELADWDDFRVRYHATLAEARGQS